VLVPLYATLAAALLFYLIVPVAGAVGVARTWRSFRRRVADLGRRPPLGYGELHRAGPSEIGSFRLYGKIEAMEEEQRIWVRGEKVSALVDMSGSPLYVLLPGKPQPGSVRRYAWKSISTLAAGTSVFVGGKVRKERGAALFVDDPEERLVVATYDGSDANVIRRLVVGGRNPNEYWTALGPVSVAIGMALSSGLLLLLGSRTAFSSIRALSFLTAMIPVLPLLPPGLGLFLLYRSLWRRALRFRVERDLFRYLSASEDRVGHSRSAQRNAAIVALAALALCVLAVMVNYILAFLLWRSVF